MTGDSIDKAGKKLTPVFGAGGCVIGGTMTIALSDGSLVMFSPQACVEGAAIGTTIGIGTSEVGKIIKYAGQAGKELSKDSESNSNSGGGGKSRNEYTNKDYDKIAKEKGMQKTNYYSDGRPVYKGKDGKYYSPEKTAHNTNFGWKQGSLTKKGFQYEKTLDNNFNVIKNK